MHTHRKLTIITSSHAGYRARERKEQYRLSSHGFRGGQPLSFFRNLRNLPRSLLPHDLHPSATRSVEICPVISTKNRQGSASARTIPKVHHWKEETSMNGLRTNHWYSSLPLSLCFRESPGRFRPSKSWRGLKSRGDVSTEIWRCRGGWALSPAAKIRCDNHPGDKPGCGSAA